MARLGEVGEAYMRKRESGYAEYHSRMGCRYLSPSQVGVEYDEGMHSEGCILSSPRDFSMAVQS